MAITGDVKTNEKRRNSSVENQIPIYTATQLADVNNQINVPVWSGKRLGSVVKVNDSGTFYFAIALGDLATSKWHTSQDKIIEPTGTPTVWTPGDVIGDIGFSADHGPAFNGFHMANVTELIDLADSVNDKLHSGKKFGTVLIGYTSVSGTATSDVANQLVLANAHLLGAFVGGVLENVTDSTTGVIGSITSTYIGIVNEAGAALDLFPDGDEDYTIEGVSLFAAIGPNALDPWMNAGDAVIQPQ